MKHYRELSQEEQDQRRDAVSLLMAYIETEDPERIADFTEMIFSFISEHQRKHPAAATDANNISEIFEEAIKPKLAYYEQHNSGLLENIYPFLSAVSLYLSRALGIYGCDETGEQASLIAELTNEYKMHAVAISDRDHSTTLVATNAKKVFDFVCLLHAEIGNRLARKAVSEYEAIFKEGIDQGLGQAIILLKDYNDLHRSVASDVVMLREPLNKIDAITSLKESLDARDPLHLAHFVKTIFSILLDKQSEDPSKLLEADAIRDLFSETAEGLLVLYKKANSQWFEALYKFLLGMESYIYAEKETYATNGVDEHTFASSEVVRRVYESVNASAGESYTENKPKEEAVIRELLYEHLVRLWRFVFALREAIEKESTNHMIEKQKLHFREGFKSGIRRASNIRKKHEPLAPHRSRWERFKASWRSLSLKWKILTGIVIVLELGAAVVCAVLFPPSVLATIPGGVAITTTMLIAASGTVSVAGTATAHAVHVSMTTPSRVSAEATETREITHEPFTVKTFKIKGERCIDLDKGARVEKLEPGVSANRNSIFYSQEEDEPFVVEGATIKAVPVTS